ncbi:MAG: hypothetical protein JRF33_17390 [Deltaproteobacteria bacterium]|nr:hypothetical protein [Deltaproteobacteria bacterium]
MHIRNFGWIALVLALVACGSNADEFQDAGLDAGSDAGVDAGGDEGTQVPLPGWGEISGECGELDDDEWLADSPFDFINHIDLGTAGFVYDELSPGGKEVYDDGNLGGSSIHSEIIAYEMLYRCELAELLKTEGEIIYQDTGGKKTDILLLIDERKVGVSVTRAFHYPPTEPYTLEEGENLLRSKLDDISFSAANASVEDAWERSMLHVIAYNEQSAENITLALAQLLAEDPDVQDQTIVVVTVTDGDDGFVY